MKNESLESRAAKVLSPALSHYTNIEIEKGRGVYLISKGGKKYLDFACGIAVTNTGHCHPKVVAAAVKQAESLIHACAGIVYYEPNVALAEQLARICPAGLNMSFFCQSGTEAIEGAIKLAKYAKNKPGIIAFEGGFHGRTLGALSVTTSKKKYRERYEPLLPNVFIAPYSKENSLSEVEKFMKASPIGGVIVEPVQGEGGYIVPSKEFLAGLRSLCNKYDACLIYDEVQTGFGRTGKMFASEHFGVYPDVMAVAKALASGFPLGAIIAKESLMKAWAPGAHGSTFSGNPVSCAAAIATIDVIEKEKLIENSVKMGDYFKTKLIALKKEYPSIVDVRGLGLMIGVEFKNGAAAKTVREACLEGGLIVITCGVDDQVIRLIPPLIVKKEQIDSALNIFEDAVKKNI
jgi:predicted acetylornithine/succinylornithine family transaminase